MDELCRKFFKFLANNRKIGVTVFVLNLGGFYGIFLFKAATKYYNKLDLSTIIDEDNKFILLEV